jgi:type I restriction enzyme, S subunit
MGEWKTVKLGEILKNRKETILIKDESEYCLCRVQLHRRGVILREKLFGSQIKTKKQQICHAGDLIVAEMDAKFGGYGFIPIDLEGSIVSNHYYLYELDKNKISQEYFQTLINTDYIQNQIEAKGSTNYSSIRSWEFLEYKIPLPDLQLQNEISKRFLLYNRYLSLLNNEHINQSQVLSKLRQSILQEAIEGKLTADWRKQNPVRKGDPDTDAAALLEKIKQEKQKMIAEGKIKKEKPLEPIKPEEIPFELPEGWIWCRLGEICDFITKGTTPPTHEIKEQGEIPYLKVYNIVNQRIDFNYKPQFISKKIHNQLNRSKIYPGDVLMNIVGPPLGKVAIVPEQFLEWNINQALAIFRPIAKKINIFLYHYLVCGLEIRKIHTLGVVGQDNISLEQCRNMIFSLPPLSEQQAIVDQINKLLIIVNELELQVNDRKKQVEELMQAVLREAFESPTGI